MNFTSTASLILFGLKILKLYGSFHFKLLLFVSESVNRISLPVFQNIFEIISGVHQHGTRQACEADIFMARHNALQFGERFFRYIGAKTWNNIPLNSYQAPSMMSFYCHLKLHLTPDTCSSSLRMIKFRFLAAFYIGQSQSA